MIKTIQGEAPFQILASNFSIGPSNEGYTLQISADGSNYSDLFSVGAGVTRMVTGVANGSYYRLYGNNSEVSINWRTQCSDGGGSGDIPIASQSTLGGIKVGSGLSITQDGVLSSTGGGGGSGYTLPTATSSRLGGVKIGSGIDVQNDGTISVSGGSADLSAYWTSAETKTYVDGEISGITPTDINLLKGAYELPENPEIGDMVSSVLEMPTFWWNSRDNTTAKMHIDTDELDTSESYDIFSFNSKDYGSLTAVLEYDSEGTIWVVNFYDENDNEVERMDVIEDETINIEVENGEFLSLGYIADDFTGLGGYMFQIGCTDGNFGNWVHNVYETGVATYEINIDGIPGIPSAEGPMYWNGTDWMGLPGEEVYDEIDKLLADIDTLDGVVSAALVDLNDKKVESEDVKHIVRISQSDYDDIDVPDPNTLYIIVNN